MRILKSVINAIAVISLILTIISLIAYYITEIISSFFVPTINMVEIGSILWKIIYVCFGSAVLMFVLAYLMNKTGGG